MDVLQFFRQSKKIDFHFLLFLAGYLLYLSDNFPLQSDSSNKLLSLPYPSRGYLRFCLVEQIIKKKYNIS